MDFNMLLALLLALLQVVNGAPTNGTCYDPRGTPVDGFFACVPGYVSTCCPEGWTCYSNNLCVVTDPATANSTLPIGTTIRGACTDPEFPPICGTYCLDVVDAGGALKACGNNEFCCANTAAQGGCDCKTGNNTFSVAVGNAQTVIHRTMTAIPTQTPTVAPSLSHSAGTTTATHSPAASGSVRPVPVTKTRKFKIGLGVGIALFAIIIGIVLWCLWRRHRRHEHYKAKSSATPLASVQALNGASPGASGSTPTAVNELPNTTRSQASTRPAAANAATRDSSRAPTVQQHRTLPQFPRNATRQANT